MRLHWKSYCSEEIDFGAAIIVGSWGSVKPARWIHTGGTRRPHTVKLRKKNPTKRPQNTQFIPLDYVSREIRRYDRIQGIIITQIQRDGELQPAVFDRMFYQFNDKSMYLWN